MRSISGISSIILLAVVILGSASAQTAEELVAKNIQAKGGLEKLKALQSVRMSGTQDNDGFKAAVAQENKRPNLVRETFALQGMTSIQAYDGYSGWQVRPFGGRKDPELMGEEDLRGLLLDADFDGPLVDYKEKGNKIESLGHDTVDGDDTYKLKVTLKNGDILYYYLDPDTYLAIREEGQLFLRGSVQEFAVNLGSYKPVNGVMFPFSVASGPKGVDNLPTTTYDKIEVNVALEDTKFAVPATLKAAAAKPDSPKSDEPKK
jgi:hypothetical protein